MNDQIALLMTIIGFTSVIAIPWWGYWWNQRYERMLVKPKPPTCALPPSYPQKETATMGALRLFGLANR